jgi:hypothetical protein
MLGTSVAASLKRRLADLHAASSVQDLVASPPVQLENSSLMAVDLGDVYRIVFTTNPGAPTLGTGDVDWPAVDRIKILRIERYA